MPIIFTPKFAAFCSLSERFNDFGDDVFWICDYSEGSTIGFTNEVFPTIDDEFLFVLVVSVIAIVVIAISFFECFVEKLLEEADSFSDLSGSFFVGEPCVIVNVYGFSCVPCPQFLHLTGQGGAAPLGLPQPDQGQ